ncbi:transcription regulator/DNA-binding protein [Haladaptatus paucihalophilus DX253]|uniref:Transcription regulator/DNA-binding protein n=1 Tax=Haladaptatus paucihalophilus DX253 TaxID=797209 RepID=E7QPM8_HALPU|nr:transcription regulator/DNA-binding protein [Haladaptatus paucihalophilus DX253]
MCGERFDADAATDDGWHYQCPNDDCDGAGIREDLYPVRDVLPSRR